MTTAEDEEIFKLRLMGYGVPGLLAALIASLMNGSGDTVTWSQTLQYAVAASPALYVYRENNAFSAHVGEYKPYTYSPDSPFVGSLGNAPAAVHGPDTVFNPGNATFNAAYSLMYSYHGSANTMYITDFTDPSNPIFFGGPISLPATVGASNFHYTILSFFINPNTGVLWAIIRYTDQEPNHTVTGTINTSTGAITLVGNLGSPLTDQQVIGFDLSGQGYIFRSSGAVYLMTGAGVYGSNIWNCDTNEYVFNFMGYAGVSGHYGIGVYNTNTGVYKNQIVNIADGTVISTLTSSDSYRGIFYKPAAIPDVHTQFNRVFTTTNGVLGTPLNVDQITGETITIPDGAVISVPDGL